MLATPKFETRRGRQRSRRPQDRSLVERFWPPPFASLAPGSLEQILRQACAWSLPGAGEIDKPADDDLAQVLVALAAGHQLLGPLLAAVDGGALTLPDDVVEEAVQGHEDSLRWCLQVEARLLEMADWFEEAGGVEFLVVKGPAVAHLDDVDPSLRFFADLDLLVSAQDLDLAVTTLERHGAARRMPQRRPGFDRRFEKSVGLTCPDLVELDVHRTLCVGAHGVRIPLDDLFAQPESFEIGGSTFRAPSLVHRALHSAYHAIVGTPTPPLRTLRDLAGYLTRADLPLEQVVAEARRWRGEAVLAEAVRVTLATLPFEAPDWAEWLAAVPPIQSELTIIIDAQEESSRPLDMALLRELSWQDRAAFLWALVFPSVEDLHARGLTPTSRVTRGVRNLIPELGSRSRCPSERHDT